MSFAQFRRFTASLVLLASSAGLSAATPGASAYPCGVITFVVGATPGGATDVVARVVGQQLSEAWGVPVVVVNRAGAGGVIAALYVAAAKPDGQTIMVTSSAFGALAGMSDDLPYDTLRDFSGIGLMAHTPSFLVTPSNRDIRTIAGLRAYARTTSSGLVYGSGGIGSTGHLHALLVASKGGFKAEHAPYRGTTEALNDVVAGRTDYAFSPGPSALPFIRQGKLRVIATTSEAGEKFAPGTQTLEQAGITSDPGDDWFGAVAPAKTPKEIRVKLSREIARILALPKVRKSLQAIGSEPISDTPDEFDAMLKQYIANVREVGHTYGLQLQ